MGLKNVVKLNLLFAILFLGGDPTVRPTDNRKLLPMSSGRDKKNQKKTI